MNSGKGRSNCLNESCKSVWRAFTAMGCFPVFINFSGVIVMQTFHCDEYCGPNREVENHVLAPGCKRISCRKGSIPEPTRLDNDPPETPLFPCKFFDPNGNLVKVVYYE